MAAKMDPQALYVQLGTLIQGMPNLMESKATDAEVLMWLGRANALVEVSGDIADTAAFKDMSNRLQYTSDIPRQYAINQLTIILYRALARAEVSAPSSAQGAFILAGSAFDAMAAVGKVFQSATKDILLVDPYLDEKALVDFAVQAPHGVMLRLLADQNDHKPSLKPAFTRWIAQYGAQRPLEAKLASARTLHDRLIAVDGTTAWTLTQSLNAFAARSPASIVKSDNDTASLKISAYEAMWLNATPL